LRFQGPGDVDLVDRIDFAFQAGYLAPHRGVLSLVSVDLTLQYAAVVLDGNDLSLEVGNPVVLAILLSGAFLCRSCKQWRCKRR
jgi:hypothetical protein